MHTSDFLEKNNFPLEGFEQNILLFYFFSDYMRVGEINKEIIPKLKDLLNEAKNLELPDDWTYVWGTILPRKDFVYLIERTEVKNIEFQRLNSELLAQTWEGSVLLDANTVESNCKKYLKISTEKFLKMCIGWNGFLQKGAFQCD